MKLMIGTILLIAFGGGGCAPSYYAGPPAGPLPGDHSATSQPFAAYSWDAKQKYVPYPSGIVLPGPAVEKGLVDPTDIISIENFMMGGGAVYIQTNNGILPIMGIMGGSFIVGGTAEGGTVPIPHLK